MSDVSLNNENFASVAHTGYLGTIAVDNEVGKFFDQHNIPDGYAVGGAKIYLGNIGDLNELKNYPVEIVLYKMGESNWEYCYITRNVDLQKLLSASINIEIRLASRSHFERDSINWNNLTELD